jgi:DNA-directed RNA polymerase specialized sigma24 family protein
MVVLALLRGQTTAEIAASQGVSPITVRTRLMRARAILRRELPDYLPPNGVAPLGIPFEIENDAA